MAHAEKCPICGGSGRLPDDGKTTDVKYPICHGCNGKGWITVGIIIESEGTSPEN